jgi:hypothetical protein
MTLDPRDRKSWQGFVDLLMPPAGYRIKSALGTTFGLSMDALTAALLAMVEADGEELEKDPVAGVIAATKLRNNVRILVHPGTISSGPPGLDRRFLALLDRLIIETPQDRGLFHPKVWALRFGKIGQSIQQDSEDIGRLIVCSRNLSCSTSFEVSCVVEGHPATKKQSPSPFSIELGKAMASWISAYRLSGPVAALPAFVGRLKLDVPHEATAEFHFCWQGTDTHSIFRRLPEELKRAVIVSPFLGPSFLARMASKAQRLQVISSKEALDALDDDTFAALKSLADANHEPAAYQITPLHHTQDSEGGTIDGLHAKVLLIEDSYGGAATYVGSANATDPGWGTIKAHNVEAMAELRPGLGIDRFLTWFVRPNKTQTHPWIMEYERSLRSEPDPTNEAERKLLSALREVAVTDLTLRYEPEGQRLILATSSKQPLSPASPRLADVEFAFRPLLLPDAPECWCKLDDLSPPGRTFDNVPLDQVSKFVVVRAKSSSLAMEKTRWLLASFEQGERTLDQRDEVLREKIMATADPAAVLNALIRGLAYLSTASTSKSPEGHGPPSVKHLLGKTPLESLLEAVAREPSTIAEMRMVLGSVGGAALKELCDDLEEVVGQVQSEISA